MTIRSFVSGVLGLLSVAAIGSIPSACQSGGVGDPCVPEDEYNAQFAGFKVSEENIESRSFQCETRICLVNHFQGRVSCPLGQAKPESCASPGEACAGGGTCRAAAVLAPSCNPDAKDGGAADCASFGGACNAAGFCQCTSSCPEGFQCACENGGNCDAPVCTAFVCHEEGNCQVAGAEPGDNQGKDCCIPGTDTPVASPVCGQCDSSTKRDAENAVYCSCRCGVAEGEEADDNFNFCECPDGFSCEEIRKNVGLGDTQITGKYCIINDSTFQPPDGKCDKIIAGGAKPTEASCVGTQTN